MTNLAYLDPTDRRHYTGFGDVDPASLIFSASGKAVLVTTARGDRWVPAKLCRLAEVPGYHPELLVPTWFCRKDGIAPRVVNPI